MWLDRLARKRRHSKRGHDSLRRSVESLEARRVLTAMVQIIHSSPYTEAQVVDLYVDGELFIDDFAFQQATPFFEAASDTDVQVDITAPDAADNSGPIYSATVNFADGSTNVVVAIGDPLKREANQPFELVLTDTARTSAQEPEQIDILTVHSAVNLGPVDVVASGLTSGIAAGVVEDIAYRTFGDYMSVPAAAYAMNVTNPIDGTTVLASGQSDLRGASGQSMVFVLSGFYAPAAGEPGLGILAVAPDGSTSLLPAPGAPARVQLAHNSPYAAAAVVDVYVEGALLLDNFAYREATPFVDLPSNIDVKIDITAPDAPDNSAPVYSSTVNLGSGSYIAVAIGDPAGTEGQPAFGLAVATNAREAANDPTMIEVLKFNGSPDSGPLDLYARDLGQVADDLAFGQYSSDYGAGAPAVYTVDVVESADTSITIGTFEADYSAGGALLLAATGFVSPATDTDPGFGLLAIYPDGTVVVLTELPTRVPGDANSDGIFDDNDLIQVLAGGKYGTGEAATWAEGDWNRDGVFDCYDIIDVMKQGSYMGDNSVSPAEPAPVAAVDNIFSDSGDE